MLATGEVFRRWQQAGPAGAASDTGSRPDRIIAAGNDLEAAATALVPAIGTVLVSLRDCEGIIAAQMSGSGTACFGLFEDAGVAATAAQRLADSGLWAVATGF